MATRHNACTNPALSVNVTGWGGDGTPTRTSVSGFDRSWSARYTSGTYARSAKGTASVGLTYTVSLYYRTNTFNTSSGNIYIAWIDSGGSDISYTSAGYSATAGVVTRLSVSGTAPANTTQLDIIVDGQNFGLSSCDFTMALIEQVASLDTYFDGDSAGATWDGTAGNSASTLNDAVAAPPYRRSRMGALLQM